MMRDDRVNCKPLGSESVVLRPDIASANDKVKEA